VVPFTHPQNITGHPAISILGGSPSWGFFALEAPDKCGIQIGMPIVDARGARDPFQAPVEHMKIPATPFTMAKFAELPISIEAGSTGTSISRTKTTSDLRVRVVEYGPGYLADHWCDRGHVFYLLCGEVTVELKDGRSFPMKAGESFQVSDDGDSSHRVRTAIGGTAFIVD